MSKTLEAEIAARAAAVDAAGAARMGGGQAPPSGESAEDAYLNAHDEMGDDDPFQDVSRRMSDEPITWSTEDKVKGDVVRPRDATGRFQRAQEPEGDDTTERAPEEAAAAETDRQADTSGGTDSEEARRDALRALRRDGFQDDELAALTDAQILRLGSQRAERQAKVDELQAKYSQANDGKASSASSGDDAAPTADLETLFEEAKINDLLADGFADESIAKNVSAALKTVLEKALSSRAPGQGTDLTNGAMTTAILARQSRAGLEERFPQLRSDGALWLRVQQEATDLFNARLSRLPANSDASERLALYDSALQDGARIVCGGDVRSAQERADRQKARSFRSNSNPSKVTAPNAGGPRTDFKTNEEIDDAWLDAQERGDNAEMKRLSKLYR